VVLVLDRPVIADGAGEGFSGQRDRPRYTSYPTVPHFTANVNPTTYAA
jgi:hypothetical protein